ncbi:MAG: DUF3014 domain-containing protein [Proteobacteria bacterium]|nr:DUF3014 domain-containing protein [Pseudomonadota bacterium]
MDNRILIAVAALVLVVLAFVFWPEAETVAVDPPEVPVQKVAQPVVPAPDLVDPVEPVPLPDPPEPEIALPVLSESDPFTLEQIEDFDLPSAWTERDDLVRRLAVVIDNAADGKYPNRQLGFLAPSGAFKVVPEGDRVFVDETNYNRFDGHVDTLVNIEPESLVSVIDMLEPLISEAMGELGNRSDVKTELQAALDQILAVPIVRRPVELVRPNVLYEYSDTRLESLTPLQKQVLRMGPDNVQRLQVYLRRVAVALNSE